MPIPPRGTSAKTPKAPPSPEPVGGFDDPEDDALPVAPNAPFFYVFYPEDPGNWVIGHVDGVAYWLPSLNKLPIIPGTHGVRTLRKGEPASAAYKEALQLVRDRGGIVIEREHGYLMKTRARNPRTNQSGHLYHDRWESPRMPRGRKKRTVKYDQDRAGRNQWLLTLVQQGFLPAPHPDIVDANIARLAERIYGAGDRRRISLPDDLEVLTDDQRANLPKVVTQAMDMHAEAVDAAVPNFEAPPSATAPKRRRKPKPKATLASVDDAGDAVETDSEEV